MKEKLNMDIVDYPEEYSDHIEKLRFESMYLKNAAIDNSIDREELNRSSETESE